MYGNILIPIVFDHGEADAIAVAKKLMAPDGRLTLLNVVETIPNYVEAYLPPGTIENNVKDAQARLESIAAKAGGDCVAHVVRGHAGQAILSHAGEIDADCIVISSHKPGVEDYFLGSTAARVVRHARCGIHVLR